MTDVVNQKNKVNEIGKRGKRETTFKKRYHFCEEM